eukprot:5234381-Pyramimonas_sp.AAC.1
MITQASAIRSRPPSGSRQGGRARAPLAPHCPLPRPRLSPGRAFHARAAWGGVRFEPGPGPSEPAAIMMTRAGPGDAAPAGRLNAQLPPASSSPPVMRQSNALSHSGPAEVGRSAEKPRSSMSHHCST